MPAGGVDSHATIEGSVSDNTRAHTCQVQTRSGASRILSGDLGMKRIVRRRFEEEEKTDDGSALSPAPVAPPCSAPEARSGRTMASPWDSRTDSLSVFM